MTKAFEEALKNMEGSNTLEESKKEREELIALMKSVDERLDRIDAFVSDARAAVEKMGTNPVLKNMFGRLI